MAKFQFSAWINNSEKNKCDSVKLSYHMQNITYLLPGTYGPRHRILSEISLIWKDATGRLNNVTMSMTSSKSIEFVKFVICMRYLLTYPMSDYFMIYQTWTKISPKTTKNSKFGHGGFPNESLDQEKHFMQGSGENWENMDQN